MSEWLNRTILNVRDRDFALTVVKGDFILSLIFSFTGVLCVLFGQWLPAIFCTLMVIRFEIGSVCTLLRHVVLKESKGDE